MLSTKKKKEAADRTVINCLRSATKRVKKRKKKKNLNEIEQEVKEIEQNEKKSVEEYIPHNVIK
jgi:hypothetical protein